MEETFSPGVPAANSTRREGGIPTPSTLKRRRPADREPIVMKFRRVDWTLSSSQEEEEEFGDERVQPLKLTRRCYKVRDSFFINCTTQPSPAKLNWARVVTIIAFLSTLLYSLLSTIQSCPILNKALQSSVNLTKPIPNITKPIQNSSSANPLGGAQNSTQRYVAFLVGLQLKLSSTSAYIQGNFN